MKERGILFKPEMITAILEGRKTMTRRVIKLKDGSNPDEESISYWYDNLDTPKANKTLDKVMDFSKTFPYWTECKCPLGGVGDLLYVKEKHAPIINNENEQIGWYHSTDTDVYSGKWKSPLFMPKAAARIWLEIIDVRVERLQDISREDCLAEGIEILGGIRQGEYVLKDYLDKKFPSTPCERYSFQSLWQSINGKESWETNPFVWAISFKRVNP